MLYRNEKIQALIGLVIALAMMVIATPSFAQSVTVGSTCVVTASALNVRSGPSTTYAIAASAQARGTMLSVLEVSGSWIRHALGWSHMDFTSCGAGKGTTPSSTGNNSGPQCTDISPLWDDVVVPAQAEVKVSDDANWQRLYLLTQHYRQSGVWTMLKAAGYRWEGTSCLQQFQPVEDTFIGTDNEVHTVIVATRLWGTGTASYPSAMSTGEQITVLAKGRIVKFDENPSASDDVVGRTCTDCSIAAGPHSIWNSGGGNTWQLWPDTAACTVDEDTVLAPGAVPTGQSADCH